jgi:hypothetical protein
MTAMSEPAGRREKVTAEEWVRRVCTLVLAGVAVYARTSISVASLGKAALIRSRRCCGRCRWTACWCGHGRRAHVQQADQPPVPDRGVGVVLGGHRHVAHGQHRRCPELTWQPILVAGWPPVALLLAVELLARGPRDSGRR